MDNKNELSKDDEFKAAVSATLRKIQSQNMILGFQTCCHSILEKIYSFESSDGSKSANDYKRLLKDLKKFAETGISHKNANEEQAEVETVQN
jgi:hypothetical protein